MPDVCGLMINEILLEGPGGEEFIELYNPTMETIKLTGWQWAYYPVGRNLNDPYRKKTFPAGAQIFPKTYYMIGLKGYGGELSQWQPYTSEQLNNTAGTIAIFSKSEFILANLVDLVGWGEDNQLVVTGSATLPPKGKSLGRTFFINTRNNQIDFMAQTISPGQENLPDQEDEQEEDNEAEEIEAAGKCVNGIKLSEIYPNPPKGQTEFVEVYNAGEVTCDLFGWSIEDLKANKVEFLKNSFVVAGGYFTLSENIGLNSTNETVFLKNGKEIIDQINYKTSKSSASYNFDGTKWRWSKWLTPGLLNVFNNLPQSKNKIPKEAYVNVWTEFSAKAKDADGDKIKYTWDFGDGHKSYLVQTRHKYEKEGKYAGSLKISDGSEDDFFSFSIAVEKYPERKVKIVKVNPNPLGKDTENETITLKNESKKKINLEDWSIATGWKTLYNHPILEKIILAPGKTMEITRKLCKFTLANKQTKIELRYPNGEVADKVKYKLEKSVIEGSVYQKVGKKWEWISQKPITKEQKTSNNQKPITNNQAVKKEESVNNNVKIVNNVEIVIVPKNTVELAVAKESGGIVLGAQIVREENGSYLFTTQIKEQKHYAAVFFKNIFLVMNFRLNTLLNYFFQ